MLRIVLAMVVIIGMASANELKMYNVSSGKVTYTITGSGNIMGAKQRIDGKKRLIFDRYGYRELTEEITTNQTLVMGHKQIDKNHKLTLRKGTVLYSADFHKKHIYRTSPPAMAMLDAASKKNMTARGEEMLKKMGGRKIGSKKVAGYQCDVWKMSIVTQCLYKGVPLEVVSNVMGIKQTERAVKAEFDIHISQNSFKLPNFEISDPMGGSISRSGLKQHDITQNIQNKQNAKQLAQMLQAGANAAKSAGVQRGQQPTPPQKQQMEDSMMQAMLPMIKQKIVSKGAILKDIKSCFQAAHTLQKANKCIKMSSQKAHRSYVPIQQWSEARRKRTVKELDAGLQSIECIKKAQTMQELDACSPR